MQTDNYPWLAHYPPGISWDAKLRIGPLYNLLEEAARSYPDNDALDFLGRAMTFSTLNQMASRFAHALQKLGLKKGDRVGLLLPNCPQFIIAYYGILKAGGVVVNINPLYSGREIEHLVKDSGCETIVTIALNAIYPKLAPLIGATCLQRVIITSMEEALPSFKGALFSLFKGREIAEVPDDERHLHFAALLEESPDYTPTPILPWEDVAVLQYTGGTTGVPKAAMLTHANLSANTQQEGYWFTGLMPGQERVMAALPFFHVFAMTVCMNLALHKGMKMIMHPRFDLKQVLSDIHSKKPTLMPGVPTMFAAIVNYKHLQKYNLTSLKMCISGGAPLPLEVKESFEKLTGCSLVEGYGLSETSPITHCNPLFGKNKKGSIGVPMPQTIPEIIDADDKVTPKNIGEIGEICIRGPQVMKGYWGRPDETALVLRDGRLHTGDLGYMDEEGYFFIVDRLKEMIISGGYNIYPRNVEEVIYMHEAVAECAVIGLPHPQRGQVVAAYVVRKEGRELEAPALKDFLRANITPYAVPAVIEFRDSLPKTLIGKISKKDLLSEVLQGDKKT